MKPRDVLFLGASIALVGALGLMMLGGSAAAGPGAPPFGEPAALPEPVADEVPAKPEVAPVAPTPLKGNEEREWTGPELTSGIIRGDISLGASVVGNLGFLQVRIKEAINSDDPNLVPFVKTLKIEVRPELGTPEFITKDIPFSEFGYVVRVFAEGLNGSQQFVQVTAERPVRDVQLSVTGGAPFSVLLRDQLKYPVVDTTVFMVPQGEPTGRPLLRKDSDNYGSAVFENVLQGEYDIVVGAMGKPRAELQHVGIQSHAGISSITIEVPRGFALTVYAQTAQGWGVEGAKLRLLATDSRRLREYEGETDFAGKHVFEHLPPGKYQLDVSGDNLQRWTRSVIVPKDAPPDPVIARVVYRR